jgi:hypothetical protein
MSRRQERGTRGKSCSDRNAPVSSRRVVEWGRLPLCFSTVPSRYNVEWHELCFCLGSLCNFRQ